MSRRHDLDLIRVAVFPLLILYHVSLIYGSHAFLVKSPDTHPVFDMLHVLTHPWRMLLLFFVSGAAAAFALRKGTVNRFAMTRMRQVLLPLVIGIVVLVPPQVYVELNDRGGMDIGLADVFRHYLTMSPLPPQARQGVTFFGLGHLWYLAYLWCYTVILAVVVAGGAKRVPNAAAWLGRKLEGPGLLVWPVLFLILVRATLRPMFPPTLDLATDWYSHALYLSAFAAGVVLAGHEGFWGEIVRYRRVALALALGCACLMLARRFAVAGHDADGWDFLFGNVLIAMFRWYSIAAILGYARRYWTKDNRIVRYANDGVLTCYLLHQTVTVLLAYWLKSWHRLGPESFLPLSLATLLICGLIYEAFRRLRRVCRQWMRREPAALAQGPAAPVV